ncbi:MAG: FG-GAP repeat domain-containing protein [Mucilaginibacter sp.]|uniref:FG-GAP repeat domain-containing protein n=1 Tax=Mucilaginibacter sp. TaxID=1882438 RepID=UPI0034E45F70
MRFLGDKRSIVCPFIAIVATIILAGCNSANNNQPVVQKSFATVKPALMQPFRFHKTIEVSPDNIFDVFSWGRGSNKTGAYLILESDSTGAKYTTTTGDLDGAITDVYNTDMDMDGNPEILIQTKAKDSTQHMQIEAFEYKDNRAQKLNFPKLTSSQKKGYRGEDQFYIKEGTLMRQFPVYDGSGADAKPTGQKRVLEYGIRNNSFTVKTVEAGDENKKQTTGATDTTKKTPVKEALVASTKTSTKSTSKKQRHHHVAERRHHATKKNKHKSSSRSSKKHRRHRR